VLTCSRCDQLSFERYDRTTHRMRDLSVFATHTYLVLGKCLLNCPSCGVRVENVGCAAPCSRYTRRFEDYVARLCHHMPVASAAELLELDWKTVKEIDKRALERQFAVSDYSGLGLLAIDMWVHYIAAIRAKVPQAALVFDEFHVIRHYSMVIDRVRLHEFNKAEAEARSALRARVRVSCISKISSPMIEHVPQTNRPRKKASGAARLALRQDMSSWPFQVSLPRRTSAAH